MNAFADVIELGGSHDMVGSIVSGDRVDVAPALGPDDHVYSLATEQWNGRLVLRGKHVAIIVRVEVACWACALHCGDGRGAF